MAIGETSTAETTITNTDGRSAYRQIADAYKFRAENAISETLRNKIVAALGYSAADIARIPNDANIGEGYGNPLAIASLKEGHIVVDLGCGGGFDCFLASKEVGASGRVIGFDMTQEMIDLAKRNATKAGASNVQFIRANINHLPLEVSSVDCVMSNCVLNLVPDEDKLSVIKEIYRVLKPCGRLVMSDFLALKDFTKEMKEDPTLRVGCVSGAVEARAMKRFLYDVGFDDVLPVNTGKNLNLYKDGEKAKSVTPCCGGGSCATSPSHSARKELDYDLNEWIASFQIYGHKWCGKTEQSSPEIVAIALQQYQNGN